MQQRLHFRKADADRLRHAGQFRLLVLIQNDGVGLTLLQLSQPLPQGSLILLELVDLRLPNRTLDAGVHPRGLAVNPLATDAALAGMLADRTIRTAKNHGTTPCGRYRFEDFAAFLAPDAEARRVPGTLPIRGSLARMRSQARRAASSKSGASTGRTCQPVTPFPNT